MTQYYSHGKLLLSGEYMVLVGAQSLAVPCKMGQSLEFEANDSKTLKWETHSIFSNFDNLEKPSICFDILTICVMCKDTSFYIFISCVLWTSQNDLSFKNA